MSRREFHYTDEKSNKFWAISIDGSSTTVEWGRIGTNGQSKKKDFSSAAEAQASYDKLVKEKTREGYQEVGGNPSPKPAPAPKAEPAPSEKKAGPPLPPPPRGGGKGGPAPRRSTSRPRSGAGRTGGGSTLCLRPPRRRSTSTPAASAPAP